MEKIPTAYQFLVNFTDEPDDNTIYNAMVEFAKLHVEQALKEASNATLLYDFKEEILNSYPLSNIK